MPTATEPLTRSLNLPDSMLDPFTVARRVLENATQPTECATCGDRRSSHNTDGSCHACGPLCSGYRDLIDPVVVLAQALLATNQ